jgi:hypothetical protein
MIPFFQKQKKRISLRPIFGHMMMTTMLVVEQKQMTPALPETPNC